MHTVQEKIIPVMFELAKICVRNFLPPGKIMISESIHSLDCPLTPRRTIFPAGNVYLLYDCFISELTNYESDVIEKKVAH